MQLFSSRVLPLYSDDAIAVMIDFFNDGVFDRKNIPILAWFIWIFIGTLFYCLYEEFPIYVAVYKSTSVGWAIGWTLPEERRKENDIISLIFSSFHNCIGVVFVGLSVLYIAQEIATSKEDWTVEVTKRQSLRDQEVHGMFERLQRWCRLHKAQLRLMGIALGLLLVGMAGGYSVDEHSFPESLDMTLSTISTCGYKGLPSEGEAHWEFILLAVYTNLSVPFFAIALASLISLTIHTPDEKYFYSKIAAPLTDKEITFMQTFGIDDGDGLLDAKEFIVLTIIRIGNVRPRRILDIITRFKAMTVHVASHMIPYASIVGYRASQQQQNSSNSNSVVAECHTKKKKRRRSVVKKNKSLDNLADEWIMRSDGIEMHFPESRGKARGSSSTTSPPTTTDSNELVSGSSLDLELELELELDLADTYEDTADSTRRHHPPPTTQRRKHKRMTLRTLLSSRKIETARKSTCGRLDKINAAHKIIVNKSASLEGIRENGDMSTSVCQAAVVVLHSRLSDPYVQSFLLWLSWLLLATLFYCLKMDMSFYRGFYMSVNVGYSIYWTQEETDNAEKAFSVVHIIVGQMMASFAYAAFARGLTNSNKKWYKTESAKADVSSARESMQLQRVGSFGSATSRTLWEKNGSRSGSAVGSLFYWISRKLSFWYSEHKVHLFLLFYLVFGVVWSCVTVGWPLEEGLYFSVSSLSTGGMWRIPENSADVQYFVVAVFTCTGAPIMGLSGGVFAHWLCSIGEEARALKQASAAITLEELGMMNQLDIDDGDGFIDETEYIILILVRMKAIRPELIAAILARFRLLDPTGLGAVPYEKFQLPSANRRSERTSDDASVASSVLKV